MAFSEIKGAIWQKQGENLVKILPETVAEQVHYGDTSNVKVEIENIYQQIAALEGVSSDALVFKGVVNKAADLPTAGYKVGDTYKVNTAGTYKGIVCEPGDALIAIAETGADSDWVVLQANIDGAVTGPASATDGAIALFDGATGKVIKAGDTLASVKQSIKTNADDIDALETNVETLSGRVDDVASDLSDLTGVVSGHTTTIGQHTTDISNLKTRVQTAEGTIAQHTSDISGLKATDEAHDASIRELGGRIDDVEEKNGEQDTAISNLRSDLGDAQTAIATNTTDISNLKGRVQTAEGTIGQHTTDISGLKNRMQTAETNIGANTTAISNLRTDLGAVQSDVTKLKSDVSDLQGDIERIDAKDVEQDGRLAALEAATCEWVALAPAGASNAQIASAAAPLKNYGLVIVPKA